MYAVTGTALTLRGVPYRNGGADLTGFDCSGFTQYVFGRHGIALPRDVKDQFAVGNAVSRDDIAAGDLVFFTTVAPGASHVGISLGGDEFVHAPSSRGVVRVEHLSSCVLVAAIPRGATPRALTRAAGKRGRFAIVNAES